MANSLFPIILFLSCLLLLTHTASTMEDSPMDYIYQITGPRQTTLSNYVLKQSLPQNESNVTNVIDACWRGKANWAAERRSLADCAVGFGSDALGGRDGEIYTVTSAADDPEDPQPGTLRYGAIQAKPLWIVFAEDMVIRLKNKLKVNSNKTIDGRGASVEIAYGPCITVQDVSHVIIHGISVHDCVGNQQGSDGDAISVFGSSHVWIDHCFLSRSSDGLVDVVHASTAITVSNNHFTQHNKVMLLGHSDDYTGDKVMKVTVAFNRFGPGLNQRMPRVRFGYAHVANNRYEKWQIYAIGGSANPTIFSEGNYFVASDNPNSKEVTKRMVEDGWKNWTWRSLKDVFLNGAFFVQSGSGSGDPLYTPSQSFEVLEGSSVPALTANAGPLRCVVGKPC